MITDLLALQASRRPGAEFVVTRDASHSYAAIQMASSRFSGLLARLGIAEGDHVAIVSGNSASFLVAWFGINLRGAVAVTLNNQLVADGLRYSVGQCDARVLVVDREWEDSRAGHLTDAQAALPRIVIESDASFLAMLEGETPVSPAVVASSAPCTVLYTSGTTGLPKGVVNCHNAYDAAGRATVAALGIDGSDRIMVFLPLFHVNPQMYAVMSALVTGATLVVLPKFSASTFFDDARRFRATGCTFVGTVLAILAKRHAGVDRDHAVRFCFGGGATPPVWTEVEERFGIKVHEVYGMTEVGGWCTSNTVSASRFGSCGRARPDIELRVVDARDRTAPTGTVGEIVVRPVEPDTILLGYYNKPEKMVESLRNLWFHTGDLGAFDEDGFLYYHGRAKDLIRRNGEMIAPTEIENALRRMPAVAECVALGVPDEIAGEEIKVAVVAAAALSAEQVRDFLSAHLPPFMMPRYFEFLAELPKTETEKIQRNRLQYTDAGVIDLSPRTAGRGA